MKREVPERQPLFKIGEEIRERLNQAVPSSYSEQENGRFENSNLFIGCNCDCGVHYEESA